MSANSGPNKTLREPHNLDHPLKIILFFSSSLEFHNDCIWPYDEDWSKPLSQSWIQIKVSKELEVLDCKQTRICVDSVAVSPQYSAGSPPQRYILVYKDLRPPLNVHLLNWSRRTSVVECKIIFAHKNMFF